MLGGGQRDKPTGTRTVWAGDGSALTLRVLVEELERRGVKAGPALRAAGFTAQDAKNSLGRVSRDGLFRFTELASELTGDPAFHIEATANAEIGAFGAADFVVTMAPTLGIGLARVATGFSIINSGMRMEAVVGTRDAYLRLTAVYEPRLHPVDCETLAVAAATRARRASGGRGPCRVTRVGPVVSYRARFEELLGCPVEFGAEEDRVYFEREVWDSQARTTHPSVRALFSFMAEPLVNAVMPNKLTPSVERIVEERLSEVRLSATDVAESLGLSTRTFHRRLASEGRRFGELLDAVRLKVSRRELERGTPIHIIAEATGFSEPAAFTRAYRRWTGVPPSADRSG